MTQYADPERCPDCRHRLAPGSLVCPACGLDLSGPVGAELFTVLARADALLAALREASRGAAPVPATVPGAPPAAAPPAAGAAPLPTAAPAYPSGPASVPPRRSRLRAASVPMILLALGALCLLVAGAVFLAVTWSVLGVAGRTGILVGLTGAAAVLAGWTARRGLRGAAEALAAVALGMTALDVYGARSAGWLGSPPPGVFHLVLGLVLVVAGGVAARLAARTAARGLLSGEAAAVVGALVLVLGFGGLSVGAPEARLATAALVTAALAALAGPALPVARRGIAAVAALAWVLQVFAAVDRLGPEPTVRTVWTEGAGGFLLLAAGLAAGAALLPGERRLRVVLAGAALVPVTLAATAPALDEPPTVGAGALFAVLVGAALLLLLAPRPWSLAALAVAVPAGGLAAGLTLALLTRAWERYADAGRPVWGGDPGGRLPRITDTALPDPWLLPVLVLGVTAAVLAALRAAGRPTLAVSRPVAEGGVAAAAAVLTATLVLHPVPVWTALSVVLGWAVVGAAVASVPAGKAPLAAVPAGKAPIGSVAPGVVPGVVPAAAAGVAAGAALLLGLRAPELTMGAACVVLVLAVGLHLTHRLAPVAAPAGVAVGPLLATVVWTAGELLQVAADLTALAALVVLGLLVVLHHTVPRRLRATVVTAPVEVAAAAAGIVVGAAGLAESGPDEATWAATYLTVAGVAASASALLRADRRPLGWLGGALLVAASWVRLVDLDVTAPEPYVLPGAAALLVVGLVRLHRDPGATTVTALGPALALGLLPSLAWAWRDPVSLRALALGVACLLLVLVGTRLRWAAPLVAGALAGAALVVREAAPYVGSAVPRWALIGIAGVLLTALGITWEKRVRQARAVAERVRSLR